MKKGESGGGIIEYRKGHLVRFVAIKRLENVNDIVIIILHFSQCLLDVGQRPAFIWFRMGTGRVLLLAVVLDLLTGILDLG